MGVAVRGTPESRQTEPVAVRHCWWVSLPERSAYNMIGLVSRIGEVP